MTEERVSLDETETETETPDAPPKATFADLGIAEPFLSTLTEMGFTEPSDVQVSAIPPGLEGRDLLVQSRTGSGKTVAFGVPLFAALDATKKEAQALVLAPTRELALQVEREFARICANSPFTTLAVYGGAAMTPQVNALKAGAQVIVGTPGRVLDHIRRGTLKTDSIHVLVLDECDEMLSMGFQEEMNNIVERLPKKRTTFLFSATIPPQIERVISVYLNDPVNLCLSEDSIGAREIDHVYYLVTGGDRMEHLLRVLEYEKPVVALIFCNTRNETAKVAEFLRAQGARAEAISSDLSQRDREKVMQEMRDGNLNYLVATDIAARGIDLADLSHVINYTFPDSADVYVHRTGRTGRAGKSGTGVSLVSAKELGSFYTLKLIHKIYPQERHLPTEREIESRREGERLTKLLELLGSGSGRGASEKMKGLAHRVLAQANGLELVAMVIDRLLAAPPAPQPTPRPSAPRSRDGDRRPDNRDSRGPRRDERDDRGSRRDSGRDQSRGPRRDDRSARGPRRGDSEDRERRPRDVADEAFVTANGEVETYQFVDAPAEKALADGKSKVYVNIGRQHGMQAADLVEYLVNDSPLEKTNLERIQIRDRHTYLIMDTEQAETLIGAFANKEFQERPLRVELAKPDPASRPRRERR